MKELWEQAIQTYNLPLTLGLGLFCLYWIISCIGIFDFDTDVDIDIDADANVDGSGLGIFGSIMNFVNATDIPIMFVLTLINTFMWGIALATNHILNPEEIGWLALLLLIANFIISSVITRYITMPLVPLFKSLQEDQEQAAPLIGQVGTVKSITLDYKYGQVEIPRDKNAPALINCKLNKADKPLGRGEEVLVVKFEKSSKRYIVRALSDNHKAKLAEIYNDDLQD